MLMEVSEVSLVRSDVCRIVGNIDFVNAQVISTAITKFHDLTEKKVLKN